MNIVATIAEELNIKRNSSGENTRTYKRRKYNSVYCKI